MRTLSIAFVAVVVVLICAKLESSSVPAKIGLNAPRVPSIKLIPRRLVRRSEVVKETAERPYRQGVVLIKRKGEQTRALEVEIGRERETLETLRGDPETDFAELDFVLTRQFIPNDPEFFGQWHHGRIGSTNAWAISVGYSEDRTPIVQLAIVDIPFQMNHPDLQANSVEGWSIKEDASLPFETVGDYHSTIAAGIAGAVVNNGIGVSGIVNCGLRSIDIGLEPTISDMYDAIVWAADHGIRVVNLSWDGAFSAVINEAGAYLKEKAGGMLFMAGVNGSRLLAYQAHPHIYAVSMVDAEDQARSSFGNHIDFAAPGWNIFSTTTNSGYEVDSGTSYSAPLMAGVAAWIMSAAPELGPAEIEEILVSSCVDLGSPGWDQQFGWGRIDLDLVAKRTFARAAASRVRMVEPGRIEATLQPGAFYRLYGSYGLLSNDWKLISTAPFQMTDGKIIFEVPAEMSDRAFFKLEITPLR